MDLKATLLTLSALFAVTGSVYASVWFLDSRYAPLAAFEDMAWSQLKGDLRELRERIRQAQNPALRAELERDLEELLDRFCMAYPSDRECRGR